MFDESATIDLHDVPLNGSVLLKVLVLSVDPYLRGIMQKSIKKSYVVSMLST